jgi:hypothetical protein
MSKRSLPSAASFPGPAGKKTKPPGRRENSREKAEAARHSIQAAMISFLIIGKIPPVRYN